MCFGSLLQHFPLSSVCLSFLSIKKYTWFFLGLGFFKLFHSFYTHSLFSFFFLLFFLSLCLFFLLLFPSKPWNMCCMCWIQNYTNGWFIVFILKKTGWIKHNLWEKIKNEHRERGKKAFRTVLSIMCSIKCANYYIIHAKYKMSTETDRMQKRHEQTNINEK